LCHPLAELIAALLKALFVPTGIIAGSGGGRITEEVAAAAWSLLSPCVLKQYRKLQDALGCRGKGKSECVFHLMPESMVL